MRALSTGLKLVSGLLVGLVLAELAFRARSGGAFPHVNFYEPDVELGVRLAPHAQMSLAFSGNPVTSLTTNNQGFRGADWPTASAANRDVLVVGDSQVFGLGVEQQETFSAQLEAALHDGGHVLNAGVPTYGPLEYTALVEQIVAERKPPRVVYVLNMANDLFELERPNRERHAVWDGWAVRSETAPRSTVEFPGRRWLMSQSHGVFALRSWLRGLRADDVQFASEGGFQDVAARAKTAPRQPPADASASERADSERARIAEELEREDYGLIRAFSLSTVRDKRYVAAMRQFGQLEGDPRDIVQPYFTESARPVRTTAFHLLFTALALDKNADALAALAKESKNARLLAHVERRRELRRDLARLAGGEAAPRNQLDEILLRTQRACEAVQAELLVVVLPLDVQVSKDEWQKYGQAPLDMSATSALNQDVAERAKRTGARVLDATAPLRAAEPGAFLKGDLHMSPRGHRALAQAIAAAWREPSPQPTSLPEGRSALPAADEWQAVEASVATGAAPADCAVTHVREWWRVLCRRSISAPYEEVSSIVLVRGGLGDAIADLRRRGPTPKGLSPASFEHSDASPQLIAPVLAGDVLELQLGWSQLAADHKFRPHHARTLRISRASASAPRVEWGPSLPPSAAEALRPEAIRAVINQLTIPHDARCTDRERAELERLQQAKDWEGLRKLFDERTGARATRCQLGKPLDCDPGEVAFGVVGRCVPACSRDKPCAEGTCTADRGRFGCIAP